MNTTITPKIAAFAEAVRAQLGDLSAEERDDLTDGLEADLAEAHAEDLRAELPDPVADATELRNAAGLPRTEQKSGVIAGLGDSMRRTVSDLSGAIDRNPALASVAEFLVVIRPLWWVVRAWVATWLLAAVLGGEFGFMPRGVWLLVLVAFVVISVQWGRGQWVVRGVRPLIVLGNVVAVLLLVPAVATAEDWTSPDVYDTFSEDSAVSQDLTGVYLDGAQVTNIFPYSADGEPLTDVQLFTQDGQALRATVEGADACLDASCVTVGVWVPRALAGGQEARNVYPMALTPQTFDDESGALVIDPDAVGQIQPLPFDQAPELLKKVAASNE